VARLATELTTSGAGYVVLGLTGLVGALLRADRPGRAIIPFLVVAVVLAVAQYRLGFGRMRRAAGEAPHPPQAVAEEARRATVRRVLLSLILIAAAIAVSIAVLEGVTAAIVGGVSVGVGVVDLAAGRWVLGRQREGVTLLREVGGPPFAGGRRPLYTRPTSERTLAT
jgi:hypothetical protein